MISLIETTYAITLNLLNLAIFVCSSIFLVKCYKGKIDHMLYRKRKVVAIISLLCLFVSTFAIGRSIWSYLIKGYNFEDALNQMAFVDRTGYLFLVIFLLLLVKEPKRKPL